jgi:hypothetical protein
MSREISLDGSITQDAAGVRACDEAKRRLAAGEDELIPAEFVNRMIDGENKVRVWREYRGLTIKALARAKLFTPLIRSPASSCG